MSWIAHIRGHSSSQRQTSAADQPFQADVEMMMAIRWHESATKQRDVLMPTQEMWLQQENQLASDYCSEYAKLQSSQ